MKELVSSKQLSSVTPNIAVMLNRNAGKFADKIVFKQKNEENGFEGISWKDFYRNVCNIAANLKKQGFEKQDKMILFSPNCLEMLEMELAVMAMGGIAVPIFAYFKKETALLLIEHSDAKWLFINGPYQLSQVNTDLTMKQIFTVNDCDDNSFDNLRPFAGLLESADDETGSFNEEISPDTICLNMYTSGTMGIPKCVQLTHNNIMSQQAAIDILWDIDENDRFLSYLPWHHSFGGIFELFTALYHGAVYALESSYGKDPKVIFNNWKKIKPTVFFSVPKVYQSLVDLTKQDTASEKLFFDSGLKFIFTAAAALPRKISEEFEKRNIPVIEGWGLTETSPCCTLTDPKVKRMPGVVGFPIPGVKIRISNEQNEIQVKGPNIMIEYYENDKGNKGIFTEDGWFRTGDVGEITQYGLRLISRKDRIFKLSNGEKVIPTDLEKQIETKCHYVQYAIVTGGGEPHPVALIFPKRDMINNPDYRLTPEEGCYCPRSLDELGKCLQGCLKDANDSIKQKFAKIGSAVIIDDELSIDNRTLTPSMKIAPNSIIEKYKTHVLNLYGDNVPVEEEAYIIELDAEKALLDRLLTEDEFY
jgi:long-subunit acyl-CoA synthetase (AMP-forming)